MGYLKENLENFYAQDPAIRPGHGRRPGGEPSIILVKRDPE